MSIGAIDKEELQEYSMIELAYEILKEKRQPFEYYNLFNRIADLKGMTKEEINERISFLYTDLNIDGRFLSLGENKWGLKSWYPLDQVEEEITTPIKPKKKAKSKTEETDELDEDTIDEDFDEDEFEDLEDELDEISNEEDAEEEPYDDRDDLEGFSEDEDENAADEEEEEKEKDLSEEE